MSKRKPRSPSYRHHRPSGQAVVTLNGRDFYLGVHDSDSSRDGYDRLIAEWLANGRRLPSSSEVQPDYTISEVLAGYWKHAQNYYRKAGEPTSELASIRESVRVLKRLYGDTTANHFTPSALMACRQVMIDSGLSRGVINGRVTRIRRVFKWAVSRELVCVTVYQALATIEGLKRGRSEARETEPVKPVPEEYIEAVLPHLSLQVRAMVELQLLTGARPGEIRIMRTCDLDTNGRVWIYKPHRHKTQHHQTVRLIYLGPRAQQILGPFLKTETTAYIFNPRDVVAEFNRERRAHRNSPMTPSQRRRRPKAHPKHSPGAFYDKNSYARAIERACDRADANARKSKNTSNDDGRIVPRWSPNRLRHNAATRFRKEYGLEVAQIMLGHKDAQVTQIYAERDEERALSVVGKIG